MWWIASRAEDEQYKGKNNLLRRGALVLGELVCVSNRFDPPSMVVASPIYRGPGPLPKYLVGRDPTIAKFEERQLVQVILTKGGLRLPKALVVTPS